MTTTHLVLGTGSVGSLLAAELVDRGVNVRAVNRSGKRGALPDAVELVAGDVTDPGLLREVTRGVAVTYQVTQPPYHRWAAEFPALQAAVIDACADAGSRLVLADNLYCYGDPGGQPINEATPERPHTVKGKVRKAMADDALAAHAEGRLEVALTRPSNYFGPGYHVLEDLVFAKARAGKAMQWLGRGDQPHAFSYTPDVARAMAAVGTSDSGWGRAWVLPACEPVTLDDLSQRIWEAAGQEGAAKTTYLRGLPMRALGLFMPAVRESVEMLYEYEQPWLVDASAFEREFGVSATPLDDAIAATVSGDRAIA